MNSRLCLPVADWPSSDRDAWRLARECKSFLSGSTAAIRWSRQRCRIVEQAYGQWLAWLADTGCLDLATPPEDRLSPNRFQCFVVQLKARVEPVSAAMMVGAILRMASVLSPERDWGWMSMIYSNLKRAAKPSRNRFAHYVPPDQLYQLGLHLMKEAMERPACRDFHPDTMYRDGLMISVLACSLIRIRNFTSIETGRHLLFDHDRYFLRFCEDETKTRRPHESDLSPELTPWIDHYLRKVRPKLLARGTNPHTSRLWVTRDGGAILEAAIRSQIENRTKAAFGRHVWPHLFRHCGVTGLIDQAPESIDIAADLLGHAGVQTTQRHYVLATGSLAHKQVQSAFEDRRGAARNRLKRRG